MSGEVALLCVHVPHSRADAWLVLVSATRGARGVGVLPDEGDAKSRVRALLSKKTTLRPGAVVGMSQEGVWLRRGDELSFLGVRRGLAEAPCEAPDAASLATEEALEAWIARGEALLTALETAVVEERRQALLAQARREATRLARREAAIESDLEKGRRARQEAEGARLFVVAAAKAPRGARSLSAVDWSSGEPVTRELPLDPAKTAKEQLDALFDRARRLASGAKVATARREDARAKRARLAAFEQALKSAPSLAALEALASALRAEDPALLPSPAPAKAKQKGAPRTPYRAFVTQSGARILVGKSASDNDQLTLHVARPQDLWLHVRDGAGSHVVVPLGKGAEAAPDVLVDAAHLAAHFSSARDEPLVLVAHTPKRYVRKRKGAPPGQVELDREKVLTLRVEKPRLEALLAREERLS